MRKFFILFVALFATSALWAQKFEAGDGLRYAVTSDSTVEVVGWMWYQEVFEIPSEVKGPVFPNEALPDLPNPGAGKVTICVQVPQPLCEGIGIAIPGTITTWTEGLAGAKGQWINKVDGTETWYAGTFDWKGDESSYNPRFKIVHTFADGSWSWDYQAYDLEFVKGDIWREYEGGDVYVGVDDQIIYIRVLGWQNIVCTDESNLEQTTYQVTGIAPYAFSGIQSHVALTIPSSISYIGEGAFSEFYGNVFIDDTIPPSGYNNGAFHPEASICVPCSALENFLNSVEGYPPTLVGVNHRLSLATDAFEAYVHVIGSDCETGSVTIEAYGANEFISFSKWSDGNTDNPRTLTLTQDTTIIAHYTEKPSYNVRLEGYNLHASWNNRWGYEETWGENIEIIAYEGTTVDFSEESGCGTWLGWSDGEMEQWRSIVVTSDTVITSLFDVATYSVRIVAEEGGYLENYEYIGGYGEEMIVPNFSECHPSIHCCVYPNNEEYMFMGWSNGNMDQCLNLDFYSLHSDTTIVAKFARFDQCGDSLTWEYDPLTTTLTITGTGDMYDYSYEGGPWAAYAPEITKVVLPEGLTSIGSYAFRNCSSLVSIAIPSTVTTINNDAFAYCSVLSSINLPVGLTHVRNYAFEGCSSITSVSIPDGVTYVGTGAFAGCSELTYLSIPSTVDFVYVDQDGWVSYNFSMWIIGECYKLKTLIAPADFFGAIDEEYAEIAGEEMPYFTRNLESLTIISGDELHPLTFDFINHNHRNIKHIDLSASTSTTLAEEAFENCYKLNSLVLPAQLEKISYMAVAECVNLQSIVIPASVVEIDDRAFENCRMLSSITFAEDGELSRIGNWAFYNNHELTNVVIPEGVTEIGHAAFYGCTYLNELTLPSTMQQVADNGFALCGKLKKMTVKAMTPPAIHAKTFFEVDRQIPVYVPDEVVDTYKNDPYWKEFNIQGKSKAPTSVENTVVNGSNVQKIVRDGQLLILREGKTYSVMGQEM